MQPALITMQFSVQRWVARKKLIALQVERQAIIDREKAELERKRAAKKKGKIFGQARKISGTMHYVHVTRVGKDTIAMKIYDPVTSFQQQFVMTEAELREMEEQELQTGHISRNEMFVASTLNLVTDRLIYRRRGFELILVFSKAGNAEKGIPNFFFFFLLLLLLFIF